MDVKVKARLGWIKLYQERQDFGYVCRHCGISRPTLRKWYLRYKADSDEVVKKALKDVTLMITYIIKHSKEITEEKEKDILKGSVAI